MSRGKFLEGIAGMFRRGDSAERDEPAQSTGFAETTSTLHDLLEELSARAEERCEAERKREAVASGHVTGLSKESAEEIRQQRLAEVHGKTRAAILETHERLGTGIDDAELTKLDEHLHELCAVMTASATTGVEPYIRAQVARRFFDETGPLAWARLMDLMEQAGIPWPASSDHARDHERAEAEEMFVHSSSTVASNLVTGVVTAWQDHYPPPDSVLWQSVCLRGCGAGLRARMLQRGIDFVRASGDELRAESESLLREQIATVKQALEGGIRTVADADQVMAGAGGLLEQVLPDLCWDRAREAVLRD